MALTLVHGKAETNRSPSIAGPITSPHFCAVLRYRGGGKREKDKGEGREASVKYISSMSSSFAPLLDCRISSN